MVVMAKILKMKIGMEMAFEMEMTVSSSGGWRRILSGAAAHTEV